MSVLKNKTERNVVPRWRLFSSGRKDLDSVPLSSRNKDLEVGEQESANDLIARYRASREPILAAEAFSIALATSDDRAAKLSAEFLAELDIKSKPVLSRLVAKWSETEGDVDVESANGLESHDPEFSKRLIKECKGVLKLYPRSALSWLDLGHAYVAQGQNEKARRAVEAAFHLNKNHRLVVRSCSRFFIHIGDFDRALWIIQQAESVKADPWLLSAHIATSHAAGKSSKFSAEARRRFRGGHWHDDQISELGAALATSEVSHGNVKLAQRISEKALIKPTENAVAQLGWLESVGKVDFNASLLASKIPTAWEARTFEEFERKNWRRSCGEAVYWLMDEPFSSRPAAHGSYVAATFLADFDLALKFSHAGFIANPDDPVIGNNYAVSLAKLGRSADARAVFNHAFRRGRIAGPLRATVSATDGLIAYREGQVEVARNNYNVAKAYFSSEGQDKDFILASIYQLEEEYRLGFGAEAVAMLDDVQRVIEARPDADYEGLPEKIVEFRKKVFPGLT